jgi:diguanylate cyclase (GGDEF)-like protein
MFGVARQLLSLIAPLLLAGLTLCGTAAPAQAGEIRLHDRLEVSHAPGRWTWLKLRDPASLRTLPHRWVLHVDQVRFERIAVILTARDGHVERYVLGAGELGHNWAPGGLLEFPMRTAGTEVASLQVGFEGIDSPALLRKVSALTPSEDDRADDGWWLLMGVFAGLLVSAFVYNLLIYAGRRHAFQRWYLAWVTAALAYGLTWTNVAAFAFPWLVGPAAVRLDCVLVGLVVALGCQFMLAVLEPGKVPRPLAWTIRAIGLACFAAGVVAADENLLDARISDLALNYALAAGVGASLIAIATAALRGSRVVWLYLLGWTPVIAVFACRSARNFGWLGQSDAIDMATFAAMGFESLVFSLMIAARFMSLKRERDSAEATARGMEIERETLTRAAHTDFLTGLGNRAFFHERMRELLYRQAPVTLFLLDVDYLKELNDRQGHDAGDALLQFIGGALAEYVDERACCARIGGDEFAILYQGSPAEAATFVRRLEELQGTVWARHTWSGMLSLSIGCASAEPSLSAAETFQRADIALYEAKKLGRGRLQEFDGQLQQQIQNRHELIKQARVGLRAGEFALHFQPIVDVGASTLVSVEALLRWNHPTHGQIGPNAFRAVLADNEMGPALQQHVIQLAIDELHRRTRFEGTLAVNFTAMDLNGREAAERLLAKLAAARVSPRSLCVEVTEGIILGTGGTGPAAALRVLHEAGVRIALDDFGTGYASLVHLKEIPVDILKIDRSFVAGLLEPGDESEEIVRAVLALGHGLKKTVVAEGVESLAQLLRLRELGCDQAQGYLFGRPSPAFPSTESIRRAA